MRFIVSVAGEGMGHATRSEVTIDYLISKGCNVLVLASGRAYDYLKKRFNVKLISGFHIIYVNGKVKNRLTFWSNFRSIFLHAASFFKIVKLIFKFKPDYVISDFEPFSCYAAALTFRKLVCLDNQHIMTKTDVKLGGSFIDRWISKLVINFNKLWAHKYIVTSFFFPSVKAKNVRLVNPIIRSIVLELKSRSRNHVLVYQTSNTDLKLLDVLRKFKQKFVVYGYDVEDSVDNLVFKKFNEDEFFNDLASCKAVVTNGGYGLISEALYLGKPIMSSPVKKQYEQYVNALHLARLGYGLFVRNVNVNNLDYFLSSSFRKMDKFDNSSLYAALDELF